MPSVAQASHPSFLISLRCGCLDPVLYGDRFDDGRCWNILGPSAERCHTSVVPRGSPFMCSICAKAALSWAHKYFGRSLRNDGSSSGAGLPKQQTSGAGMSPSWQGPRCKLLHLIAAWPGLPRRRLLCDVQLLVRRVCHGGRRDVYGVFTG